jgi:hypothetical protein
VDPPLSGELHAPTNIETASRRARRPATGRPDVDSVADGGYRLSRTRLGRGCIRGSCQAVAALAEIRLPIISMLTIARVAVRRGPGGPAGARIP